MAEKMDVTLDEIIHSTESLSLQEAAKPSVQLSSPTFTVVMNNEYSLNKQSQRFEIKTPGIHRVSGKQNGRIQKRKPVKRFTRDQIKSTWAKDSYEGQRISEESGTKLFISNLHYRVSDSDIFILFKNFGYLKNYTIHYDRTGRSFGTASVVFENRDDALKAMQTYNGLRFEGRVMNIQLATSEIPEPKSQTRAPERNYKHRGGPRSNKNCNRNRRSALTAEQLDAELDAYRLQLDD